MLLRKTKDVGGKLEMEEWKGRRIDDRGILSPLNVDEGSSFTSPTSSPASNNPFSPSSQAALLQKKTALTRAVNALNEHIEKMEVILSRVKKVSSEIEYTF